MIDLVLFPSSYFDVKKVDEDLISKNLYTSNIPDPDLLIRTSGEQRISNYKQLKIKKMKL